MILNYYNNPVEIIMLPGLDNLHEYLKFSYPRMRPPSFFCENESSTGMLLHYRSKRRGYAHYTMGQIKEVLLGYAHYTMGQIKEVLLGYAHYTMGQIKEVLMGYAQYTMSRSRRYYWTLPTTPWADQGGTAWRRGADKASNAGLF